MRENDTAVAVEEDWSLSAVDADTTCKRKQNLFRYGISQKRKEAQLSRYRQEWKYYKTFGLQLADKGIKNRRRWMADENKSAA